MRYYEVTIWRMTGKRHNKKAEGCAFRFKGSELDMCTLMNELTTPDNAIEAKALR